MATTLRRVLLIRGHMCARSARVIASSIPSRRHMSILGSRHTLAHLNTRQMVQELQYSKFPITASVCHSHSFASIARQKGKPPGRKPHNAEEETARKDSRHDPVAFTKRVERLLVKDEIDRALTVMKAAETQGFDTMVAWNSLLQHILDKGNMEEAFKNYNKMKKMGRMPNAQTYTLMLRGYAKNPSKKSLRTAMSIYESISASNSIVKPSTIHHNAALEVCARHYDLDALWKVVGKIPDVGHGSADGVTFTTVLNGIRATREHEIESLKKESTKDAEDQDSTEFEGELDEESEALSAASAEKKASAVREGKSIWADVIHRLRSGNLRLDQQLVSAMGQLLSFGGRERDLRDVFLLMHQAMGIPIPAREGITQVQKRQTSPTASSNDEFGTDPDLEVETDASEETKFEKLFDPVNLPDIQKIMEEKAGTSVPSLQYPLPANSHLSLIMETCRNLRDGIPIAREYWSKITDREGDYQVKPDSSSYHEYLRLLRIARASAEALRVVREMVGSRRVRPKRSTFVIALSACSRDRNNHNILKNAGEVVDLAGKHLPEPDLPILEKYLDLVRVWARKNVDKKNPGTTALPKIADALSILRPQIQTLSEQIGNPSGDPDEEPKKGKRQVKDSKFPGAASSPPRNMLTLLQSYQNLIGIVLDPQYASLIPEASTKELQTESNRLRKFMGKHHGLSQMQKPRKME